MILQTYGQPFDLGLTLSAGQAFGWHEGKVSDGWWSGVIKGQAFLIRQPDGKHGEVEFQCSPGSLSAGADMLSRYFRLDDPIAEIYATIGRDQQMAVLVNEYDGLRLLRQDLWECLISYICSPRNDVKRIEGMVDRLSRELGSPITSPDNRECYAFPTPEALASAGVDKLNGIIQGVKRLGVSVHKAADEIHRNIVNLESLSENSDVITELMKFHGVRHKISNCVALFSLDQLNAFPIDTNIRKGTKEIYPQSGRMTDAKLQSWAQGYFAPYAGYAGQFIFHHFRQK